MFVRSSPVGDGRIFCRYNKIKNNKRYCKAAQFVIKLLSEMLSPSGGYIEKWVY